VKNNSVGQRVDLEDWLPTSVSLESATPSQGSCDYRRDSASGRDVVQCAFGVVRSESMAEVEFVVTPTAPGDIRGGFRRATDEFAKFLVGDVFMGHGRHFLPI